LSTAIDFVDDAAPRRRSEPRPWGKYGLRTTAVLYLGVMVVLPIVTIARRGFSLGLGTLARSILRPVPLGAIVLTLETAGIMAIINAVMGTLVAYVLVRYRFPGKKLMNLVIDLPFSIPTLVAGLMIVALFGPEARVGRLFAGLGLRVLYAPPAIVIALLFVTLPFVVRAVQPVLMEVDIAEEEAAYTLGASGWAAFSRVVLPAILPAILTGTLLSFARALGEFGSIVVVAGNIPRRTLTAAVHVFGEVESGNYESASAMSLVLIAVSLSILLLVDAYQRRELARRGQLA
jgi:sulfate/thiosulfate transport system permease protein